MGQENQNLGKTCEKVSEVEDVLHLTLSEKERTDDEHLEDVDDGRHPTGVVLSSKFFCPLKRRCRTEKKLKIVCIV